MLSDPLSDLNIIREAIDYARNNLRNTNDILFWCDGEFSVVANTVLKRSHWDSEVPLLLISAEQYCEIFLRTLDIWED